MAELPRDIEPRIDEACDKLQDKIRSLTGEELSDTFRDTVRSFFSEHTKYELLKREAVDSPIDGPYGRIPKWLFEKNLSPTSIAVYGLLAAKYTNTRSDIAWPSRKTISKDLGISVPTVDKALVQLQEAGALFVIERKRSDGSRSTNGYQLAKKDPQTLKYWDDVSVPVQ